MKIETIICGQSNVYLLHGNQAAVLIDTGTAAYRDKVLKCCRNANVRLIILTRGHFDHCQNAAYLAKQLNCSVGIAKEDVPLLENHQKRKVFGKGIWGKFYACVANRNIRSHEIEAMTPDIILEDDMSLSQYGIDGKIVKLAGHAKGSIGIRLSTGGSVAFVRSTDAGKIFYGHGR